jgi:hypothetical protein
MRFMPSWSGGSGSENTNKFEIIEKHNHQDILTSTVCTVAIVVRCMCHCMQIQVTYKWGSNPTAPSRRPGRFLTNPCI